MSARTQAALIGGMVDAQRIDRRRFVTLLFVGALAAFVACPGPNSFSHTEVRPSGTYGEVLTFASTAPARSGEHVLYASIVVDSAKLMGWAKGNRPYTTSLAAKLTGPGVEKHATLYLPITEQQEVGREGATIQVAFLPAGKMSDAGFHVGERKEAFRYRPKGPGDWTLTIEMRTANNADQMMIKAIRTLVLETEGHAESGKEMSAWKPVP